MSAITDEYGNVIDLNGAVVQVSCFPGTRNATLSIVHVDPNLPPHLRGALIDRPRVESLIRSLQSASKGCPMAKPLTRTNLLAAYSCIASARGTLLDATTATKQSVRNSKADHAAFCLWRAAQELRRA